MSSKICILNSLKCRWLCITCYIICLFLFLHYGTMLTQLPNAKILCFHYPEIVSTSRCRMTRMCSCVCCLSKITAVSTTKMEWRWNKYSRSVQATLCSVITLQFVFENRIIGHYVIPKETLHRSLHKAIKNTLSLTITKYITFIARHLCTVNQNPNHWKHTI